MASQVLSNSWNISTNESSNAGRNDSINVVAIWSVSVLAVLIAATIFGNILVCTAFCLCRELRSVTNQFVVSLAISDLLVAFVSMPMWLVYQISMWPQNSSMYTWWLCFDIVSGTASIMNLVIISVDRYCAITSPYQYEFRITKARAKMAMVLVWGYSLVVAGIRATPFYRQSWARYYPYVVATASYFVPLPVMIYCYVQIFRVAHEQAGKIRRQGSGGYHTCQELSEGFTVFEEQNGDSIDAPVFYDRKSRTSHATTRSSSSGGRLSSGAFHTHFKRQRPTLTSQHSFRMFRKAFVADLKAAKTLAIVMGSFIVCWSPFIIMNTVFASCKTCFNNSMATTAKWLHYSNSAMNPIIYTVMNRAFRDAFRKIMCRQLLNYENKVIKETRISTLLHMFSKKRTRHAKAGEKSPKVYKMESEVTESLVCKELLTVV